MASEKDIARIVAELSAAYPNWGASKYTTEIYFQDLKDIDSELLFLAVKHCRTSIFRDQRFAPSAGEIRVAASDLKRQAEGVPSALEAWGELLHVPSTEETKWAEDDENGQAVIITKPYQWSHPLVRKVAIMMGFPRFPDWDSESYERAAFLKVYEIELQSYLKNNTQLPEVTLFVETRSAQIETEKRIKQLTQGFVK